MARRRSDGTRLSLRGYAAHRKRRGLPGGTHKAVQRAIESGRIAEAVGDDGLIDPTLADRLWEDNTRHAAPPGVPGMTAPAAERNAAVAYAVARAKLTLARAAEAEYQLGILRRDYIHQDDVDALIERPLAAVAAALKNVPARHAHALAKAAGIPVPVALRLWADGVEEVRAELRKVLDGDGKDS